jgi:hypothetical protein
MVEIDHKIIISGIAALAAIETVLILCGHDSTLITSTIVGAIALSIGVVIPIPKIDNNRGTLIW